MATKKKVVLKGHGKRGRPSHVTEEFWTELRAFYEGGSYTQRQLADYARTRGIVLSQPSIARRAMEEGWVKGKAKKEIEQAVLQELRERVGDTLGKMLERHAEGARVAQSEIYAHFRAVQAKRAAAVKATGIASAGDEIVIGAALLRQLVSGLHEAEVMEAKALGFNYKTGKPFAADMGDDEQQPTRLTVRSLTAEEEEEIRRNAEKDDDNDGPGDPEDGGPLE